MDIPNINIELIEEIWFKIQSSSIVVSSIKDLNDIEFTKPIIYLSYCDVIKSQPFLKFGVASVGVNKRNQKKRLRTHLNSKKGQLTTHFCNDKIMNENFDTFDLEFRRTFIENHCCFQIYEINDKELSFCKEIESNSTKKHKYINYWTNIFKSFDANQQNAGPVEFLEKPIEQIFLRKNRLLRYTKGVKNDLINGKEL